MTLVPQPTSLFPRETPRKSTRKGDNVRRNRAAEHVAMRKQQIGKCQCCGLDDIRCLTFHHVDPSKKSFSLSEAGSKRVCTFTIDEEIAKCVLVCENCHRKIHNPISPDEFPEELMRPLGFLNEGTKLTEHFT